VIVNDVAEVNIDNKLIVGQTFVGNDNGNDNGNTQQQQQQKPPSAILQLSNGCACCTIADELLPSISQLITVSDLRNQAGRFDYQDDEDDDDDEDDNNNNNNNIGNNLNRGFDHIVVELSGVASPKAIRANFQEASYYGMPLMDRVRLDTMVTVVDCSTYLSYLPSLSTSTGTSTSSDNSNSSSNSSSSSSSRNIQDMEGGGARMVNEEECPELFYTSDDRDKDGTNRRNEGNEKDDYNNYDYDYDYGPRSEPGPESSMTVSELIVEQTEISDIILLNKIDTLVCTDTDIDIDTDTNTNNYDKNKNDDKTITKIENLVSALNSRAKVFKTKFGAVDSLRDILGASQGLGVSEAGIGDDHREYIEALEEGTTTTTTTKGPQGVNEFIQSKDLQVNENEENENKHGNGNAQMNEHSMNIGIDGEETHDTICSDPNCNDTSHSHTHSHSHNHDDHHNHGCGDDGSAEHEEPSAIVCTDPNCNDASHAHDHSHSHSHSHTKAQKNDIGTFIYRARRPFHPLRLSSLVHLLPVARGLPPLPKEIDNNNNKGNKSNSNNNSSTTKSTTLPTSPVKKSAFGSIVRSKGFAWLAHSHIEALYWSQAGSSFEMQCLGRWWASLDRSQWPNHDVDAVQDILADFDNVHHIDIDNDILDKNGNDNDNGNSISELLHSSVGDRRQEIVFIGQGLGDSKVQCTVKKALDSCLLTDDEFMLYKQSCSSENDLRVKFVNPMNIQMMTY